MTCKVVFDTSTLVSAAIRPLSIPDQALLIALRDYRLCTCIGALQEAEEVIRRPRFDSYVGLASRIAFHENVRSRSLIFTVDESILNQVKGCCRDVKDEVILALALSAQAEIIVSSDHDLLVLHPWRGISILSPGDFLAQLSL